jgi:hypothetical protein
MYIVQGQKSLPSNMPRTTIPISSVNDSDINTPTLHLRANNNIIDINVTEDDVKDVLKNLKTGKACGSDNISHQMLKGTAKQRIINNMVINILI